MTDPAQVRMDDLADQRRERILAAALAAAGYNPAPYVGQEWEDPAVTWLPDGHRSIVTITGIYQTTAVERRWSCTVIRRQVDASGATVESGAGEGVIFLGTLVRNYRPVKP